MRSKEYMVINFRKIEYSGIIPFVHVGKEEILSITQTKTTAYHNYTQSLDGGFHRMGCQNVVSDSEVKCGIP